MQGLGARIAALAPETLLLAAGGGVVLVLALLFWALSASRRAAQAVTPLMAQVGTLGQTVQMLSHGQQQLLGGLTQATEAQAAAQSRLMQALEHRLG